MFHNGGITLRNLSRYRTSRAFLFFFFFHHEELTVRRLLRFFLDRSFDHHRNHSNNLLSDSVEIYASKFTFKCRGWSLHFENFNFSKKEQRKKKTLLRRMTWQQKICWTGGYDLHTQARENVETVVDTFFSFLFFFWIYYPNCTKHVGILSTIPCEARLSREYIGWI